MRLRNNEIAACVVIAVGVGGVLIGSLFQDPLMHQASVLASTLLPVPTATPMPTPLPTPAPTPEPTPTVETVRFSATGDNLIHDGIFLQARQRGENGSYDFTEAYEPMRTFYEQFDVNWLNQETLVNDAFEPSGYPLFSTPGDITDALYDIGFRVFSVSNNHSYDKGAEGITSSLEHWAAMPDDVAVAGFYNQETYDDYTYQTVNGITFGYLSYTEYTNGLPTPSESEYRVIYLDERDLISQQIADMRPTETAQWLADQGVDLIIGTHPHVTQTAQWLTGSGGNTTFVAYSLGNFLNAQSQPDNMVGAVLDITFQKTTQSDGSVSVEMLNPKLHGVVTQYEAGYQDIRVYPYADYTDELGAAHGNFTLSRTQIEEILSSSIDSEFLTLD